MNSVALTKPILIDGRIYPIGEIMQIDDAALLRGEKDFARAAIRTEIERSAGDAGTREGVTSDVLAVLLLGLCDFVEKIGAAKSIEQVRESTAALTPLMTAVNSARQAGLQFPFEVKGATTDNIVADLVAVSNGVSSQLKR